MFGSDTYLSATAFSLYDHEDNLLYTKSGLNANAFYISTKGSVFTVNEKYLYMYAIDGKEMCLEELNCPNNFGFSPDNFLFFSSDKDGITAYSNQGTVIYSLRPGRLFASTERGELIAIVAVDTVFIYEHGVEKLKNVLTTPYARGIVFSDNNTSIIVDEPTGTEIIPVPGRIREEQ